MKLERPSPRARAGNDRETKRAALGAKRHVAGRPEIRRERCVQTNPGIGVEKAQTVRTDHAHAVAANFFQQGLLARASFGADLGETGGDDDRRAHTALRAIINDAADGVSWNRDHGQVGSLRQRAEARISFQRSDLSGFWIHRIDVAAKAGPEQSR